MRCDSLVIMNANEGLRWAKEAMDAGIETVKAAMWNVSEMTERSFGAAKKRTRSFLETGTAHYQQTEDLALSQFRGGLTWLRENQTGAVVLFGVSAVVLLPGLRRFVLRQTLRPFRSDESIYRSAEARLESVQGNLKQNQERTAKLEKDLSSMIDTYASALQQLKSSSQELQSFSNQIYKDIRRTQELIRDMKDMPSRPSLKMQSEAAVALSALERQNRQVDNLIYRVMQKGI